MIIVVVAGEYRAICLFKNEKIEKRQRFAVIALSTKFPKDKTEKEKIVCPECYQKRQLQKLPSHWSRAGLL